MVWIDFLFNGFAINGAFEASWCAGALSVVSAMLLDSPSLVVSWPADDMELLRATLCRHLSMGPDMELSKGCHGSQVKYRRTESIREHKVFAAGDSVMSVV